MPKISQTHGKYKGVVVSITDVRKIRAKMAERFQDAKDFIIFRFTQIGEEAVKIAREKLPEDGSFHDVTGNLRSSIGYVVLHDGREVPVKDGVKAYPKGESGAKGVAEAQQLMSRLKAKFPYGIVLILCAGMEYAAFVENVKHKDVLTSASHLAEALVNKLLKNIVD